MGDIMVSIRNKHVLRELYFIITTTFFMESNIILPYNVLLMNISPENIGSVRWMEMHVYSEWEWQLALVQMRKRAIAQLDVLDFDRASKINFNHIGK